MAGHGLEAFKYRAFISYSWKDRVEAEWLHRALESYRPPRSLGRPNERLHPIFKDREEEAAGASLREAIEEALDQSQFLIVICSPNSAASPWVNKEVAYFRKKRSARNILSCVIAGEPGASLKGDGGECFPPALLYESDIEGVVNATPIEPPLAADAREAGDGRRVAKLKIAAAMLNVGLDDLVRRDQQRRARLMRYALAGSSAITLAMTALTGYAIVQRNAAVENEKRAAREALKAERTAEFMVGLFEVADPSEARGREVTAKEILDKGVGSIEQSLANEPDVQGSLMHTMGRVYTGLGLYPDAARILHIARAKRAETKADPEELFATENALARAEFEKGDLDKAKEIYSQLVATAETEIAEGRFRIDHATALTGMGETTLYRDTPEEAQKYYERARELLKANGKSETEEMAEALQALGGIKIELGSIEESLALLTKAKEIYFAARGPNNLEVTSVDNDIAHAYYKNRELPRAEVAAQESYSKTLAILGEKHPETLISWNNLARYQFERGELAASEKAFESIVSAFREIGYDQDFYFVYPLNSLGEIKLERGLLDEAVAILSEAARLSKQNEDRLYGPINISLGRANCDAGRTAEGIKNIMEGRDALASDYEASDWRFGVADEYESRCLAAARDDGKARELARSAYASLRDQLGDAHYFTQRAKKWAATSKADRR